MSSGSDWGFNIPGSRFYTILFVISSMRPTRFIIVALLCLLGCYGCSTNYMKTESVKGKVTLDGVPVEGATIDFRPLAEEGDPGYATSDSDGNYTLQTLKGAPDKGTTPGEYSVTVLKDEQVETGRMIDVGYGKKAPVLASKPLLPKVYRDPKTSPLKYTVKKGKNVYDIELTSTPPQK